MLVCVVCVHMCVCVHMHVCYGFQCVWHMQRLGNGVIELANGDEPQCHPVYRRLPFLFSLPVLLSGSPQVFH